MRSEGEGSGAFSGAVVVACEVAVAASSVRCSPSCSKDWAEVTMQDAADAVRAKDLTEDMGPVVDEPDEGPAIAVELAAGGTLPALGPARGPRGGASRPDDPGL